LIQVIAAATLRVSAFSQALVREPAARVPRATGEPSKHLTGSPFHHMESSQPGPTLTQSPEGQAYHANINLAGHAYDHYRPLCWFG